MCIKFKWIICSFNLGKIINSKNISKSYRFHIEKLQLELRRKWEDMTIVLITAVLLVLMYGLYVAAYISENVVDDSI